MEGGVRLHIEVFSVAEQLATLGGEQRARLLLCEEPEREVDNGGGDDDEEAHLLVAHKAGEGLVLVLGGSRRPASKILDV